MTGQGEVRIHREKGVGATIPSSLTAAFQGGMVMQGFQAGRGRWFLTQSYQHGPLDGASW